MRAPQAAELACFLNDRPHNTPVLTRRGAVIDNLHAARIDPQAGLQRLECAFLGAPDLCDQRVSVRRARAIDLRALRLGEVRLDEDLAAGLDQLDITPE